MSINHQVFERELRKIINEIAKVNLDPSVLERMVNKYGAVDAVRRLLPKVTTGFRNLIAIGRTDLTIETLIQRFPEIFSQYEIQQASEKIARQKSKLR